MNGVCDDGDLDENDRYPDDLIMNEIWMWWNFNDMNEKTLMNMKWNDEKITWENGI